LLSRPIQGENAKKNSGVAFKSQTSSKGLFIKSATSKSASEGRRFPLLSLRAGMLTLDCQ
jgi:hypothetical protein